MEDRSQVDFTRLFEIKHSSFANREKEHPELLELFGIAERAMERADALLKALTTPSDSRVVKMRDALLSMSREDHPMVPEMIEVCQIAAKAIERAETAEHERRLEQRLHHGTTICRRCKQPVDCATGLDSEALRRLLAEINAGRVVMALFTSEQK